LRAKRFLFRERKLNWLRSLEITLLYLGLSCRQTAEVLSFFDEASHEAVRQWYHRAQALLGAPPRRCRRATAIEEEKLKVRGGGALSERQSISHTREY
jgi:transposase-like protein